MTSFRTLPQAQLGTAFLSEFEDTVERILDLPLAVRVVRENVRRRRLGYWPGRT